jgi:hypothetical protein
VRSSTRLPRSRQRAAKSGCGTDCGSAATHDTRPEACRQKDAFSGACGGRSCGRRALRLHRSPKHDLSLEILGHRFFPGYLFLNSWMRCSIYILRGYVFRANSYKVHDTPLLELVVVIAFSSTGVPFGTEDHKITVWYLIRLGGRGTRSRRTVKRMSLLAAGGG